MNKSSPLKRIAFPIFFIYCFVITSAHIFCVIGGRFSFDMGIATFSLILSFLLAALIYKLAQQFTFSFTPCSFKIGILWFCIAGIFSFAIFFFLYLAVFPGYFVVDSYTQWNEALSGQLTDWHPYVHTLLFFSLPYELFHSPEAVVFLQIIWFSLACAYLTYSLRRIGCSPFLCALNLLFILLNTTTLQYIIVPVKDTALALVSMVLLGQYVQIISSKGEWLYKKAHFAAFILFLTLTSLIRHNAILFTFPLLLSVLIHILPNKKRCLCLVLSFVCAFGIFKGPVASMLNVSSPGERVIETSGMCMIIMGNAVTSSPHTLDPEVRDFLYQVASPELWQEKYVPGDFNWVKWSNECNHAVIERAGYSTILRYTMKTILTCPLQSLYGFLSATRMVWDFCGEIVWRFWGFNSSSELATVQIDPNTQMKNYFLSSTYLRLVEESAFSYVFNFIGWIPLFLLALVATRIKTRSTLRYILHILPLFCYNFGTALLLTGFDFRFFYLSYCLVIPTICIILRESHYDIMVEKI